MTTDYTAYLENPEVQAFLAAVGCKVMDLDVDVKKEIQENIKGIYNVTFNKTLCGCGALYEGEVLTCLFCKNSFFKRDTSKKTDTYKKLGMTTTVARVGDTIEETVTSKKYCFDWTNESVKLKEDIKVMVMSFDKEGHGFATHKGKPIALSTYFNAMSYGMMATADYVKMQNDILPAYLAVDTNGWYNMHRDVAFYLEYPNLRVLDHFPILKAFAYHLYTEGEARDDIDFHATTPSKIFKLPKSVLKAIEDRNSHLRNLRDIQVMVANYGEANAIWLLENFGQRYNFEALFQVLIDVHPLKQLKNYILHASHNQAMHKYDVLQMYSDYVRMSKQMEVGFEKFPRSLKLIHDVRTRDYRVVISANETKMFMKAYKENYEDTLTVDGEVYEVLKPQNPKEVVEEGQALNHCVASYVTKVAEGKGLIYFLRRQAEKNKSYITLELDPNKTIVQMRGRGNRSLTPAEKDIVKAWAKKQKLTY